MIFNWTYEKGEAKCEYGGYAMFARPASAFIMKNGDMVEKTDDPHTLMEAVLWCENMVMKTKMKDSQWITE
jgi:hypothetical protein